jgi:hypothetical protein
LRSQAVLNPIPIGPPVQIHPAKVDAADTSTCKSTSPSSLRHGPHEARYTLCTSILPLRLRAADDYCCPFRVHFESGPSHRDRDRASTSHGHIGTHGVMMDVSQADHGTAPTRCLSPGCAQLMTRLARLKISQETVLGWRM